MPVSHLEDGRGVRTVSDPAVQKTFECARVRHHVEPMMAQRETIRPLTKSSLTGRQANDLRNERDGSDQLRGNDGKWSRRVPLARAGAQGTKAPRPTDER